MSLLWVSDGKSGGSYVINTKILWVLSSCLHFSFNRFLHAIQCLFDYQNKNKRVPVNSNKDTPPPIKKRGLHENVDKSLQPLPAGGDSSQDEAEEEAKAITVHTDNNTQWSSRKRNLRGSPNASFPKYVLLLFLSGEVCSSRVGAGPAEEDPVVRVPAEEAGRGALGSPAVPRCEGERTRKTIPICIVCQAVGRCGHIWWPCFWPQDGRSDHEKQYLFCPSVDASENSELVKSPKWVAMISIRSTLWSRNLWFLLWEHYLSWWALIIIGVNVRLVGHVLKIKIKVFSLVLSGALKQQDFSSSADVIWSTVTL